MYIELRTNIISTVYNSWRTTGFAWEQYNAISGIGQRTQGFTGWTALVVNILAMPDLADAIAAPDMLRLPAYEYRERSGYDSGGVFGFSFLFVVVVVVLGAVFKMRTWFSYSVGRSREERPSEPLYIRLRHVRSFWPPGF